MGGFARGWRVDERQLLMAGRHQSTVLLLLIGAAAGPSLGCSLIADGSQFQGGDAGTTASDGGVDGQAPDGGGPDGAVGPQQRLIAVEAARREAFCQCFAETFLFDSETDCVEGLDPGPGYAMCRTDVFRRDPDTFGPGVACSAIAQEATLACERAAGCMPGEFNDCQLRLDQELASNRMCALDSEYFTEVAECASLEVVGDPLGDCPGPMLSGSFIVGDTVGSGSDYDLVDSPCFPRNAAGDPVNRGAADQGFQWQAQTPGDVLIDTIGSNFDTVLYLTDGCDQTTSTECNDDYDNGVITLRQSRIRVPVTTGQVLNVVIDSFARQSFGAAVANFTALGCADQPTDSIPRAVGPSVFTGIIDATADDDLSSSCALSPEDGPDVVLAWEAPASGTYTFSTAGSMVDTVLYLRRSCDADDLASGRGIELGCNDDTLSSLQSEVSASLNAGQVVLVVVETIGGRGPVQVGISGP